ncbi:MAG: T9SS type A sorting domain-containing protein [Bacteroidota bacterium]
MKKILILSAFCLLCTLHALTYENAPPASRTNAPGESNCTGCHGGTSLQTSGSIWNSMTLTSSVPLGSFLPNTTYTMNLTFADPNSDKYGFQVLALPGGATSSSASVGSFSAPNTSVQTQTAGSRNYVNTTASGTTATGNTKTWTFSWTTPTAFSGSVTFYAVVNSTDNNSSSSGDVVYAKTFSANVLPVTWLTHSAQRINRQAAEVSWSTASEYNNRGFYIEKSSDALTGMTVSFISGKGQSKGIQYYTYTDNDAGDEHVYYRIKQVDFDGTHDYTPLLSIQAADRTAAPVISWTNGTLRILNSVESDNYELIVYTLRGERIREYTLKGHNHIPISTEEWQPGVYIVYVKGFGEAAYRKICVN